MTTPPITRPAPAGLFRPWDGFVRFLEGRIAPLAALFARILVFRIFFYSGLTKINDWAGAVFLFREEYKVPIVPPELAAALGTVVELGASSLVLIGLAARLATLPLIGLTCVIQFVVGAANPAYDSFDHFLWLALLGLILSRGPGPLSVDHLIARWRRRYQLGSSVR